MDRADDIKHRIDNGTLTIAEGLDAAKRQLDARRAHQGLPPIPVVEAADIGPAVVPRLCPPLPTADEVHGLTTAKVMADELHRFATGAVRSKDADEYAYELVTPIGILEMASYFADHLLDYGTSTNHYNAALAAAYKFLATGDSNDIRRATANVMYAIQYERTGEGWGEASGADERSRYRFDRIPPAAWALLARRYRFGQRKYGALNNERGMDVHALMNHGIKHVHDHLAGDTGDDNPGAALWNFIVAIHSLHLWPKLNGGLRRGDCVPPNVSDEQAKEWGHYFA